MTTPPPPPYSEAYPQIPKPTSTTATSLKKLIIQRDTTLADFLVKVILRKLESLKFESLQPFGWASTKEVKNGNEYKKSPLDNTLGFRTHDWRSRFPHVTSLANQDLTRRGFQVKYIKFYESKGLFEEGDFGLVIEWSVECSL